MSRIETTSAIATFTLNLDTGFAQIKSAAVVLVRFKFGAEWEQYRVIQSGSSKGLEMFVRYLPTDLAAEAERAERVACAGYDLRRLDALVERLMYPALAA